MNDWTRAIAFLLVAAAFFGLAMGILRVEEKVDGLSKQVDGEEPLVIEIVCQKCDEGWRIER